MGAFKQPNNPTSGKSEKKKCHKAEQAGEMKRISKQINK